MSSALHSEPWFISTSCAAQHVWYGVLLSSYSYLPQMGESPRWLRLVVLCSNCVQAVVGHGWMHAHWVGLSEDTFHHLYNLALPGVLLGITLFCAKLSDVHGSCAGWVISVALFSFLSSGPLLYNPLFGLEAALADPSLRIYMDTVKSNATGYMPHAMEQHLVGLVYLGLYFRLPARSRGKILSWL